MTSIHLIRESRDGKAVRGRLRFEGQEIATLENADYIIPVGIYEVRVTYSPRFKRMLPLVMQVPGRSGIRFHRGTRPEHSKGCILVSAANEQQITAKWLALQASNEPLKSRSNMKTESEEKDWVKVLYEVILKILTLGFYHVEKHRKS